METLELQNLGNLLSKFYETFHKELTTAERLSTIKALDTIVQTRERQESDDFELVVVCDGEFNK